MSRLSNNIDTLLAFHDCVIIPSFGAIIKEQVAPYYDREKAVLYPGKRTLHFNKELRERDGFLDEIYAHNYGLSKRRARLLVDQDVEDLIAVLHRTGKTTLNSIGSFHLVDNGVLDFLPENSSSPFSSGDSYGLVPYYLPSLQEKASLENFFVQEEQQEKRGEDYFYFRIHKRATAWVAAAVILVICLLPVTYQPVGNYFSAGVLPFMQNSRVENATSSDELLVQDVLPQESSSEIKPEENAVEKSFAELPDKAADKVVLSSASPVQGYYVVIGAFRTEQKVLSFIESCKDASFASTMGYLQKGSRKVIYAVRKDTAEEAQEFIRSLLKTDPTYSQAWVLHYSE
ncbi:HU domain-containing protein [Porphyromonas circumdentaria]|uniref:SPOR domain-containing protein n=1 Tax=Porphyromonas circumdentaria TaxID=29524 RepID=A0A1T4PFG4_9PORP|nr:hypothetical protein [Porphyromonas circumdentaria]MBB6275712.1 hypothetical protein [Porphyromonas circumdentaria]SJZ90300.1 hypothetical protein SAMN02745171_01445 [Porphyromonas circumdentaria]